MIAFQYDSRIKRLSIFFTVIDSIRRNEFPFAFTNCGRYSNGRMLGRSNHGNRARRIEDTVGLDDPLLIQINDVELGWQCWLTEAFFYPFGIGLKTLFVFVYMMNSFHEDDVGMSD